MGLAIRVIVSGDKEMIDNLQKLGQSFVASKEAMEDIGTELASYFAGQVFVSRGGIIEEPWAELDSAYEIVKAKRYPGRSPLVRSGEMQGAFNYEADDMGVTIFNTSDHFSYHQSDEPRTSNLPRRVMMKANDDVKKIVAQIIDEDVVNKIKKAGF